MRTLIYIIGCVCVVMTFYSCNDNDISVIKSQEELYEDSLKMYEEELCCNQLLSNLCNVDTLADGSISYVSRHGEVLEKTTPTIYYIGVNSLEEAKQYFKRSIALAPKEENLEEYRNSYKETYGDYSIEFSETASTTELARVKVDCPELKDIITEIVFIPCSLWPVNDVSSPFQYASVWMDEPVPGSYDMTFYICVRPCGYGQKGIMLTFDRGWGSISYDKCTYYQGKFSLYSNCASLAALNGFYDMINEFPTNKKFKSAIDNIRNKGIEWCALDDPIALEWVWKGKYGTTDIDVIMRKINTTYDICMKALNKEYLHFNVGSPNPSNPEKAEKYWWAKWRWYYLVDVTYYTMTYNSDKGRYDTSSWTTTFKEKNTPYNVWPSYSFEFDYDNYPRNLIKVGK